MEAVLLGLIIVINIIGFVILFKRSQRADTDDDTKDTQSFQMLNQNIQGMQTRLDTVSTGLNERLDNAARVISTVSKELGTMQEIGRGMQELQDFLKSPKLRGNIGEQVLQQMLDQCFPNAMFEMQYQFTDGQMVDAILKTDDGLVPIDSKFPMENYQRMAKAELEEDRLKFQREFVKDVKKHVNDIAKKYILPDQGTVDFAVMYVPSEVVYYEIIRNENDLNFHGMERSVIFVSPNSFYYFLKVIMMGMQGKKVADATKEIIATIKGIQKDSERFSDSLSVLNKHITHSKTAVDRVSTEYAKLEGKIDRIDDIDAKSLLE